LSRSSGFWLIVSVSVAIRTVLSPFTGHPYDLGIWLEIGQYVARGSSPYSPQIHLGYPPLWGFWCGVSYTISSALWPGNEFLYIFLIKFPILLADLAIVWMLLRLPTFLNGTSSRATTGGEEAIRSYQTLAALFLLNPYFVTVGVVWGMMDNLVAFLVVASIIAMVERREAVAGALLAAAVSLKLYPVLFIPATMIFILAAERGRTRMTRFAVALGITAFTLIAAPFLILGWDVSQFYSVLVDQTARIPMGISPIGILGLLEDIGINKIGPFEVTILSDFLPLRLFWIPAVVFATALASRGSRGGSFYDLTNNFSFVYIAWILTAPRVSEQNVAPLLIFTLAQFAVCGVSEKRILGYGFMSAVVLAFAFFNVPVTSFLFPAFDIDPRIVRTKGKEFLPYLSVLFAAFAVIELWRIGKEIRNLRHSKVGRRKTEPVTP
jgi:hypothetical protein